MSSDNESDQGTNNNNNDNEAGDSNNGTSSTFRSVGLPQVLHNLLDDAAEQNKEHIISWVANGTAFKVHDKEAFVRDIMPKYFDTGSFKSYQRSVNLWNFNTVRRGPQKGYTSHDFFKRGDRELCKRMKRVRIKGNGKKRGSGPSSMASGMDAHSKFMPSIQAMKQASVSAGADSAFGHEGLFFAGRNTAPQASSLLLQSFAQQQQQQQRIQGMPGSLPIPGLTPELLAAVAGAGGQQGKLLLDAVLANAAQNQALDLQQAALQQHSSQQQGVQQHLLQQLQQQFAHQSNGAGSALSQQPQQHKQQSLQALNSMLSGGASNSLPPPGGANMDIMKSLLLGSNQQAAQPQSQNQKGAENLLTVLTQAMQGSQPQMTSNLGLSQPNVQSTNFNGGSDGRSIASTLNALMQASNALPPQQTNLLAAQGLISSENGDGKNDNANLLAALSGIIGKQDAPREQAPQQQPQLSSLLNSLLINHGQHSQQEVTKNNLASMSANGAGVPGLPDNLAGVLGLITNSGANNQVSKPLVPSPPAPKSGQETIMMSALKQILANGNQQGQQQQHLLMASLSQQHTNSKQN